LRPYPNFDRSNKEQGYSENSDESSRCCLQIEQGCNSENKSDDASGYVQAPQCGGQDSREGADASSEETADDQVRCNYNYQGLYCKLRISQCKDRQGDNYEAAQDLNCSPRARSSNLNLAQM